MLRLAGNATSIHRTIVFVGVRSFGQPGYPNGDISEWWDRFMGLLVCTDAFIVCDFAKSPPTLMMCPTPQSPPMTTQSSLFSCNRNG
eukprot:3099701-Amphidinium_carterae.1